MVVDEEDVPYGEDFHDEAVAAAWADAAAKKRPFRAQIFERFAQAINDSAGGEPRVLELGAGPGFLAERVLDECPRVARYTLLDFSQAMLEQSRARLARHLPKAEFVRADFKSDGWFTRTTPPFDFVLSQQAVHELRHKRHAPRLYAQVRELLLPGGRLLVCDHLPEGAHTPRHRVLYMSVAEHVAALEQCGFSDVQCPWSEHNMALFSATA
ncbi:MAG TPA: class I SAM-dependent methyltransferase [Polyangiaceae bacterium]|nr:class I SAM-dependent methyltransferase [Polyangiaceae bacterium]